MRWRDCRAEPPKPGSVIIARGDYRTIIGRVEDWSRGGLMHGQLCIDGIWDNTGHTVTRIVAELRDWMPLAEALKSLEVER